MRNIELREFERACLPREALSEAEGEDLFRRFSDKIAVDPPSFRNGGQWVLRSEGWVGRLPISSDLLLAVEPKVPVGNLFGMLEYAYALKDLDFPGLVGVSGIDELFDRLATLLAKRVLRRAQRGLHASYVLECDELPYLRGSLDVREHLRRPWKTRLHCEFEDHTRDIDDNRILSWTLYQILQSAVPSSTTRQIVRRAFQTVAGAASVVPFPPAACVRRLYHRLNEDYEPLHALCRFFLEQMGPTHRVGDRRTLPFLLDMARLFELFVAEWLSAHLPAPYRLKQQENLQFGDGELRFRIDLVLYDVGSQEPVCILDTKYKDPLHLSEPDVHQVVAYAEAKQCTEAVLIYPAPVPAASAVRIGAKTVRRVAFTLDGDLDAAGAALIASLPLPVPAS